MADTATPDQATEGLSPPIPYSGSTSIAPTTAPKDEQLSPPIPYDGGTNDNTLSPPIPYKPKDQSKPAGEQLTDYQLRNPITSAFGSALKDAVGTIVPAAGMAIGKAMQGVSYLDPEGLQAFKQVGDYLSRGFKGTVMEPDQQGGLPEQIEGGAGALPAYGAVGAGIIPMGFAIGNANGHDRANAIGKPELATQYGLEDGVVNAAVFALLGPAGQLAAKTAGIPAAVISGLVKPTTAQAVKIIAATAGGQQALFQGQNMFENWRNGDPLFKGTLDTAATTLPFAIPEFHLLSGAPTAEGQIQSVQPIQDAINKALAEPAPEAGTPEFEQHQAFQTELTRRKGVLTDFLQSNAQADALRRDGAGQTADAVEKINADNTNAKVNYDELEKNLQTMSEADLRLTATQVGLDHPEALGAINAQLDRIQQEKEKQNETTKSTATAEGSEPASAGKTGIPAQPEPKPTVAEPAAQPTPETDQSGVRGPEPELAVPQSNVGEATFDQRPKARKLIGTLQTGDSVTWNGNEYHYVDGRLYDADNPHNYLDPNQNPRMEAKGQLTNAERAILEGHLIRPDEPTEAISETATHPEDVTPDSLTEEEGGDHAPFEKDPADRDVVVDTAPPIRIAPTEPQTEPNKEFKTRSRITDLTLGEREKKAGVDDVELSDEDGAKIQNSVDNTIKKLARRPDMQDTVESTFGPNIADNLTLKAKQWIKKYGSLDAPNDAEQNFSFKTLEDTEVKDQTRKPNYQELLKTVSGETPQGESGKPLMENIPAHEPLDVDARRKKVDQVEEAINSIKASKDTEIEKAAVDALAEKLMRLEKDESRMDPSLRDKALRYLRDNPDFREQVMRDMRDKMGMAVAMESEKPVETSRVPSPHEIQSVTDLAQRVAEERRLRLVEQTKEQVPSGLTARTDGDLTTVFFNPENLAKHFWGLTPKEAKVKMHVMLNHEFFHNAVNEHFKDEIRNDPQKAADFRNLVRLTHGDGVANDQKTIESLYVMHKLDKIGRELSDDTRQFVDETYHVRNYQLRDKLKAQLKAGTIGIDEAENAWQNKRDKFANNGKLGAEYMRQVLEVARTTDPKDIQDSLAERKTVLSEEKSFRIQKLLRNMGDTAIEWLKKWYDSAREMLGFDKSGEIINPEIRQMVKGVEAIIYAHDAGINAERPPPPKPQWMEMAEAHAAMEPDIPEEEGEQIERKFKPSTALEKPLSGGSGDDRIDALRALIKPTVRDEEFEVKQNIETADEGEKAFDKTYSEGGVGAVLAMLKAPGGTYPGINENTRRGAVPAAIVKFEKLALQSEKYPMLAKQYEDAAAEAYRVGQAIANDNGRGTQWWGAVGKKLSPATSTILGLRDTIEASHERDMSKWIKDFGESLLAWLNRVTKEKLTGSGAIDKVAASFGEKLKVLADERDLKTRYEQDAADKVVDNLKQLEAEKLKAEPEEGEESPEKPALQQFYDKVIDLTKEHLAPEEKEGEEQPEEEKSPTEKTDALVSSMKDIYKNYPHYQDALTEIYREMQREGVDPDLLDKIQKAMDAPFQEKQLRDAALENFNPKDFIYEHYTATDPVKISLKDKIIGMLDLPPEDAWKASRLALEIENVVRKEVDAAKQAEIDRLVAREPKAAKLIAKVKDKLLRYSNLGMLDQAAYRNIVAKELGMPYFDEATAAQVKKMFNELQTNPRYTKSDIFAAEYRQEISDYIKKQTGIKALELYNDWWYRSILDGMNTHVIKAVGVGTRMINETLLSSALELTKGRPHNVLDPWIDGFRGLIKSNPGALKAFLEGKFGEQLQVDAERPSGASAIWVPKNETLAKVVDAIRTSPLKYLDPYRLLMGTDVYAAGWMREMRAGQIARDMKAENGPAFAAIARNIAQEAGRDPERPTNADYNKAVMKVLGITPEQRDAAEKQAAIEGHKEGSRDWKQRVAEITRQLRPDDIQVESRAYAVTATYLNKRNPNTVLGQGAISLENFINNLNKPDNPFPVKVAGFFAKRLIPFTRITTNIADENMNYAAIGAVRSINTERFPMASKYLEGIDNNTPRDINLLRAKMLQGAVLMLGVGLWKAQQAANPNPTVDITGRGPSDSKKKKQWMDMGNKPYSFRVGDTNISYQAMPFAAALAGVANYFDAEKYDNLKGDSDLNVLAASQWHALTMLTDASYFGNASRVVDALKNENQNTVIQELTSIASSPVTGLVPNLVKEAYTWFDPKLRDTATSTQPFLSNYFRGVPVLQDIGSPEPKMNILGEDVEVTKFPGSREFGLRSNDPLWQVLQEKADKGVFLTQVGTATKENTDGTKEKLTGNDLYNFKKQFYQTRAGYIRDNLSDFQAMTPEQAKTQIKAWNIQARKEVLGRGDIGED